MASENFSTPNIWPNYSASNVARASTKTQTLGKDQFLSILITQLQNQDPMQPMEDKEFIAQMAQFSSVEQLMNISNQLTAMNQSLGNVSGLIGKEITWLDSGSSENGTDGGTGELKSGIVDSILVKDGVQYAAVGSSAIPLTKVIEIKDAPKEDTSTPVDPANPADPADPSTDGESTPTDTSTPGSGESI
ncbi:flagellar hook capping protein [Paenibacillus sp. HJL G12]|uniref:Flagellar hook capping protein n=1 Tax=Paenibacillus dendrobii TaxID=2691084 RepID=A0A7X3IHQ6_9BACL|nr:flagellar hook capping FlgD N-terminal domain-containing protein [Paenibacillus dendrobii]MWV43546.1 flagellar hook capping protein [Paenibacillus dendrobii]